MIQGTFQQADITIPMSAIHCIEGCGLAMLCRYILTLRSMSGRVVKDTPSL
jgi:hypothetical protein